MNTSFIQRAVSVLFASLLASAAVIGCQAEATGEPAPDEDVAATDQALTCQNQCAHLLVLCYKAGHDQETCEYAYDTCIEACED